MKIYLDIGGNHNQDLNRMNSLISSASDIPGVAGVKIQLFRPGKLWAEGRGPGLDAEREVCFQWDMDIVYSLAKKAQEYNLEFGISVFDLDIISELDTTGILTLDNVYLKISALDSLRNNLLFSAASLCTKYGRPLHVSINQHTTKQEIGELYQSVKSVPELVVYSAVSVYPAYAHMVFTGEIHRINNSIRKCIDDTSSGEDHPGMILGYSDHTSEIGTIIAVMLYTNAKVLELHYDLDDWEGRESRVGHCWSTTLIWQLIECWSAFKSTREASRTTDYPDLRADPSDGLRPQKKYRDDVKK